MITRSKIDTMAARQNQISWAEFSHHERLQHQLQADFIRECRANAKDKDEEKFDISVSTPRRGAQTKRREQPRVRFVFERQPQQHERQPQQHPETPENNNEKAHEQIKKPKTRAEKRAVETEATEQIAAIAAAPKHKERRSDYWVEQDDLRMKRARGFKLSVEPSTD